MAASNLKYPILVQKNYEYRKIIQSILIFEAKDFCGYETELIRTEPYFEWIFCSWVLAEQYDHDKLLEIEIKNKLLIL